LPKPKGQTNFILIEDERKGLNEGFDGFHTNTYHHLFVIVVNNSQVEGEIQTKPDILLEENTNG